MMGDLQMFPFLIIVNSFIRDCNTQLGLIKRPQNKSNNLTSRFRNQNSIWVSSETFLRIHHGAFPCIWKQTRPQASLGDLVHGLWLGDLVRMLSCFCRVWHFATPWTVAHQAPLSMRFPRQEYWSELPYPPPGDLPDPGIKPTIPALEGRFFTTESPGKPCQL